MKENVLKLLDTYCNAELSDFRCHKLYDELRNISNELGYLLVSDYGRAKEKRYSRNIYLGVSIYNQNNESIEIYDEGDLSASTELIVIDKKERIQFLSWHDEDFIDSMLWMIQKLNEIKLSKKHTKDFGEDNQ